MSEMNQAQILFLTGLAADLIERAFRIRGVLAEAGATPEELKAIDDNYAARRARRVAEAGDPPTP